MKIKWLLQDVGKNQMLFDNFSTLKKLNYDYENFGLISESMEIRNLESILTSPDDSYIIRGGVKILTVLNSINSLVEINQYLSKEQIKYQEIYLSKLRNAIFYDEVLFDQKHYNKLNLPLINQDAQFLNIKNNLNKAFDKDYFVKPSKDLKAFTPGIMKAGVTLGEFISNGQFLARYIEENALLSSVKEIKSEYRFFVVENEVITGSLYKNDNKVIYDEHIDENVWDTAVKYAQLYQPHDVFTMDLAQTNQGIKIVEYNCWNGSGLYKSNKEKIFTAVNDYQFKRLKAKPKFDYR